VTGVAIEEVEHWRGSRGWHPACAGPEQRWRKWRHRLKVRPWTRGNHVDLPEAER